MFVKGPVTKSYFCYANIGADLLIGKLSIKVTIRVITIQVFALMIKGVEKVCISQSRTSLAATGPE